VDGADCGTERGGQKHSWAFLVIFVLFVYSLILGLFLGLRQSVAILAQAQTQTIPLPFPHNPPTLAAAGSREKVGLHLPPGLQSYHFKTLGGSSRERSFWFYKLAPRLSLPSSIYRRWDPQPWGQNRSQLLGLRCVSNVNACDDDTPEVLRWVG
jgi:hypothetical protein